MTTTIEEKGREKDINTMIETQEVAEEEAALEEEVVAADTIAVDNLRTNVDYTQTETMNGVNAERTQIVTIMIRTQQEADEEEAEKPVEAFKDEVEMEAVAVINNLTIHKVIFKQIKIFTTDIIRMEAPCLNIRNQEFLRVHQVCRRNLKHIITKACPTGAINLISEDSTDGDTVTATRYLVQTKMATGYSHV